VDEVFKGDQSLVAAMLSEKMKSKSKREGVTNTSDRVHFIHQGCVSDNVGNTEKDIKVVNM
jgi:hypothetical protein